jgi:hypothetical protein
MIYIRFAHYPELHNYLKRVREISIYPFYESSMKYVSLIFFLVGFIANSFHAQKTYTVSDIKGTALIYGDVSPNQAKTQALIEAKINALKAAGIKENLNSYQVLYTSQQKNDYSQFFTSDVQTEIQGAVQSFELKSERTYCKNEFEIVYETVISATVIKYQTSRDITFDANVDGIKKIYNNDDPLTFNIKTTQPCYITIFNITDSEATLMYPNAYESQAKCTPMQICQYPTAKINYVLHTDKTAGETNRLIFVFTKSPIPFIKMDRDQVTTAENIFTWIYSIMPDQRKVEYLTLSIQK